jgi:CheY-like chemotaxis protein
MRKKNILLVDDDKIFNLISRKTIEAMGIAESIHIAMNGKEAIDLFNNYFAGQVAVPDYIFLDLNMPLMDGFEFIKIFNTLNYSEKEKIKIVVVTSSSDTSDMDRVKALGVKYYLNKPITEEKIRSVLNHEKSLS